jgi:hypothetical protein
METAREPKRRKLSAERYNPTIIVTFVTKIKRTIENVIHQEDKPDG